MVMAGVGQGQTGSKWGMGASDENGGTLRVKYLCNQCMRNMMGVGLWEEQDRGLGQSPRER